MSIFRMCLYFRNVLVESGTIQLLLMGNGRDNETKLGARGGRAPRRLMGQKKRGAQKSQVPETEPTLELIDAIMDAALKHRAAVKREEAAEKEYDQRVQESYTAFTVVEKVKKKIAKKHGSGSATGLYRAAIKHAAESDST